MPLERDVILDNALKSWNGSVTLQAPIEDITSTTSYKPFHVRKSVKAVKDKAPSVAFKEIK